MESKKFFKTFAKRGLFCYFIIMLMFFTCILRVAVIATTDYSSVISSQNCLRLKICDLRGTVFDRNMIPLSNNRKKIIAAVSPTPRGVTAVSGILKGEELENVLNALKSGKPVLCELPEAVKCDGIICTEVYETDADNSPAVHTVGYTDRDGNGVTGLQKAYDEILKSEKDASVLFECNGKGKLLEGVEPEVENDSSVRANGVVTTLDRKIQSIAENEGKFLETGAVVIADAKSGKLRAVASFPDFNIAKISDYLNSPDSPLLNRAVNAYNVGSVFKPCVASAGIENGKGNFSYTCTGKCEIIDRFFKCHNASGHGLLDLKGGLANSCNTYFYNFAFNIGADKIYNTASVLKFGKQLKLGENFYTAKGNLAEKASLQNFANLANMSIGQGELLLTPISILTLYCAIANDGSYISPSLIEGTVKDGKFTEYDCGAPTRVMSKATADSLKEYLSAVLTDGTGQEAIPQTVTAAGKTATAQTGKWENGTEICEGWFCGFFPADNPEYVVVVFSENTKRQSVSCAKIFATIADKITEMK